MKTLTLLSMLLGLVSSIAAQTNYSEYRNDRYAFSFKYPSDLLKGEKSDIGLTLKSSDKRVKIFVYASLNVNKLETGQYAHVHKGVVGCMNGTYSKKTASEFVFVGTRKKNACFLRVVRRTDSNSDVYYNVIAEYPNSRRGKWKPIVDRIAESLASIHNADVQP